ncbi:non-lysosomal glucosylceramidase [Candidatus Termititenax dinenymphae]|uniref:Non-lysosomal glucosylceramidase n=1 Tax=Candidatus Termititenax dinenymphae TaxID=2218523 RepID=A0A388TKN0_9BACT|nr:non-lysosomal glucosylceramidase [Candidatus Termititenax dinenymphae]
MVSALQLAPPKSAYSTTLYQLAQTKLMKPKADYPMINSFPHGAPLGGFGAGTFSRSPYGDFNIWHLFPGVHINEILDFCELAVYRQYDRKTESYPLSMRNKAWGKQKLDPQKSVYSALYPKSWYQYQELDVTVEQFSPILPHNYKETAYPAACFNVQIQNTKKQPMSAAVLFSWQNILGWSYDPEAGAAEQHFIRGTGMRWNERRQDHDFQGIVFHADPVRNNALSGEMCLATRAPDNAQVSFCTQFDTEQNTDIVWEPFAENGILRENVSTEYDQPAGAIAVKVFLNPGETVVIPFVLTWDIPNCLNGNLSRYYTKYWGTNGDNAFAIAAEVLENQEKYSADIRHWHETVAKKMPLDLTALLFNELYYLADGGSIWDAKTGLYSYLECYDYLFYETLDVRFFGAFPLAKFWPEIEKRIMTEFSKTIFREDQTKVDYHVQASVAEKIVVSGDHNKKFIQRDQRKRKYALPHDLGSPLEAPWEKINAYTWQNANRWKDLNSKYVLQVYRAYYYSGKKDHEFLSECWTGILRAIEYLSAFDDDKDGLPENEGFPDQTFDNWLMNGTSAYCGILRLASLQAAIQIAAVLNDKEQTKRLRLLLKQAKDALNAKLWNGKYFKFDEHSDDVMAAQLAGQWFLEQMHLPDVLEPDRIDSALKYIYETNFLNVENGSYGLVNGRTAKNQPVKVAQGNDAWAGVNYAFAGHLLIRGQKRRAEYLLRKVKALLYGSGFLFRTPEGWDVQHKFLASMYMRPGVIWALEDWY